MRIHSGTHSQDARLQCGGAVSASVTAAPEDHQPVVGDAASTFPQKLMRILDDTDYHEIISWNAKGCAFLVHQKDLFESQIMPKYFSGQSKYASFTRQLNRWGFTRTSHGTEAGTYVHPYFLRGQHRLLLRMACRRRHRRGAASPSNPWHRAGYGGNLDQADGHTATPLPRGEAAGTLNTYLASLLSRAILYRQLASLDRVYRLVLLKQSLASFEQGVAQQQSTGFLTMGSHQERETQASTAL